MSAIFKNISGLASGLCLLTGGIIWGAQSARPQERDEDGMLPIHVAAQKGNIDDLRVLLEERGADPNVRVECPASRYNREEWDDYRRGGLGKTPLHLLSEGNSDINTLVNCATLLLEKGAEVRAQDAEGRTPLHLAAYYVLDEDATVTSNLIRLLLAYGATVNAQDDQGNTPLHAAVYHVQDGCRRGTLKVVQLLLTNKADPNAQNKRDETPLNFAMRSDNVDIIETLVRAGTWMYAADRDQWTLLNYAENRLDRWMYDQLANVAEDVVDYQDFRFEIPEESIDPSSSITSSPLVRNSYDLEEPWSEPEDCSPASRADF